MRLNPSPKKARKRTPRGAAQSSPPPVDKLADGRSAPAQIDPALGRRLNRIYGRIADAALADNGEEESESID